MPSLHVKTDVACPDFVGQNHGPGINYFGTQNELHGCVSDVQRMLPLLDKLGFPSDAESRRVLVDAPDWPQHLHPTLANMRQGIAWLIQDAQPGDSLLFHYSGHGGRMPRSDGRSEWHETLCPVDMDAEGMLLDSELFETLVRPLPSGCRLTCLLDSCHSGGVLDLPFIFVGTQENLASALAGEAAQMVMSKNWLQDWQAWQDSDDPAMLLSDAASMGMDLWSLSGKYSETREANEQGFRTDEAENAGVAVAPRCSQQETSRFDRGMRGTRCFSAPKHPSWRSIARQTSETQKLGFRGGLQQCSTSGKMPLSPRGNQGRGGGLHWLRLRANECRRRRCGSSVPAFCQIYITTPTIIALVSTSYHGHNLRDNNHNSAGLRDFRSIISRRAILCGTLAEASPKRRSHRN